MKAFDRALEIKPEAYVYINRAQVRPYSDRAGRMADLEASLKLDPKNPDALAEVGKLRAAAGDFKGAFELYDRAAKDSPDNSVLRMMRAAMLYRTGRNAEAEKAFAALHGVARTATDFNSLCWTKATMDLLLESALANCREALKLSPGNAAYEDSLGMVLLKLGKLDDALTAYKEAVAKHTGAASLMGRAFVYARKGDRSHAESDAAAARKLYSDIDAEFAGYGLKFDDHHRTETAE
jgi:Flp pilus assembly protein TadD